MVTISLSIGLITIAYGYVDGNNNGKDDVKEYQDDLLNSIRNPPPIEDDESGITMSINGQTVNNTEDVTKMLTHNNTIDTWKNITVENITSRVNQTEIDKFCNYALSNETARQEFAEELGHQPTCDDVLKKTVEGLNGLYTIITEIKNNFSKLQTEINNNNSNISGNNTYGQTADTPPYFDFSSYYLDTTIRYPQDWVYNEWTNYTAVFSPSSEVSFLSDLSASPSDTYVKIVKQQDLPFQNMPLELYFDYEKKLKINQGYNITNTGKANLSDGTPAYEILAVTNNSSEKTDTVIMNKNSESYYFVYGAPPDKFDTYLPVAQQMFKTLSFKT
jgi:hypothetical protein